MRELNRNLYPSGGYYYVERDGTKLTAENWLKLEIKVKEYRKNRGFPVGDIHRDVMEQACDRNPGLCHEVFTVNPPGQKVPTIKARVFEWLGQLSRIARKSALDYVSDTRARERVVICARCPQQKDFSTHCSACEASLGALRQSVLAGRAPVSTGLGACGVLGVDLRVAVHLAEPPSGSLELPEACWRKLP